MTISVSKHQEALNKGKYVGKRFRHKTGGHVVTFLNYDIDTAVVKFQDLTTGAIYALTRERFFEDYFEEFPIPYNLVDSGAHEQKDMVNHPPHYKQGKIEIIDFIEDQKLNYHLSSVIKYVCRSPHKGSQIEDLQKALWYLKREINNLQMQVVPDWDNPTTRQGEIK